MTIGSSRPPALWEHFKQQRVLNILKSPIQTTPTARLYSAVIQGLGSDHGAEEGTQAAEWLSWQILCDGADLLLNSDDCSALEEAAERFIIAKESVSIILT